MYLYLSCHSNHRDRLFSQCLLWSNTKLIHSLTPCWLQVDLIAYSFNASSENVVEYQPSQSGASICSHGNGSVTSNRLHRLQPACHKWTVITEEWSGLLHALCTSHLVVALPREIVISPWPTWVPVCIRCTLSYSADSGRGPSGLSQNRG